MVAQTLAGTHESPLPEWLHSRPASLIRMIVRSALYEKRVDDVQANIEQRVSANGLNAHIAQRSVETKLLVAEYHSPRDLPRATAPEIRPDPTSVRPVWTSCHRESTM